MIQDNLFWLIERLPPVETIKLRCEPDYYGISHIIAAQTGRKNPPRSFAGWLHGWKFTPSFHVRQLAHWGSYEDMHLVATEEQVKILNGFGFNKAEAVGLPFIYSDDVKVQRKQNTLLVMPSHSLSYTEHRWNQEAYVKQVAKLKPYFSSIVACVHSACVSKGYWVSEFEKHDIPWITGASVDDKNALQRMKTIFQSFEYMTTNVLGSHIAYASYCACKVSIYGFYAIYSVKDFINDLFYKENPDLLEKSQTFWSEEWAKNNFPEFFVPPMEAIERQQWGADALGVKYQKSAKEIADLLGWSLSNQVQGYSQLCYRKLENKFKATQKQLQV
ncbi:hypothetical protein [Planktothricoides raciborskii]|uniref:Uncharacterized protein n=2 Tax=Planktothricoides raciborskii TaxID=132608 RepID=A0AAU8J6Y0_9CYAN|nr:hypothetical protein [Planktothricoides raciborskii]MBD2544974.1 hypothetical protein [Planktothricoides raciborskii FACHB-1370]MBD2584722.1 hypothetical protein [Planktothricoides raciborskii FACHB-1261]